MQRKRGRRRSWLDRQQYRLVQRHSCHSVVAAAEIRVVLIPRIIKRNHRVIPIIAAEEKHADQSFVIRGLGEGVQCAKAGKSAKGANRGDGTAGNGEKSAA